MQSVAFCSMLKYCEVKMAAIVRHSSRVSVALVEKGKGKTIL